MAVAGLAKTMVFEEKKNQKPCFFSKKPNKPLVFLTKFNGFNWLLCGFYRLLWFLRYHNKEPIILCISIFIISEEIVD